MKRLGVLLKGRYLISLSLALALALFLLPLVMGIDEPISAQSLDESMEVGNDRDEQAGPVSESQAAGDIPDSADPGAIDTTVDDDLSGPDTPSGIEVPGYHAPIGLMMSGGYGLNSNGGGAPESSPPLLSSASDAVDVDYEVDEGFPWFYSASYSESGYDAYLAGNSFSNQANVSNIAFTVTAPGVFSFDYKLSTPSSGSLYALYYNVNVTIDSSNYQSARNFSEFMSFRGIVDWTNVEFNITREDLIDGEATVYIAYYRGGTSTSNENMAAIANVCFISGEKTLTLLIEGGDHGHVTDGENDYFTETNKIDYESGDAVTFTAVPNEGNRFYGWVDGSGKLINTNETYSFVITANTTLTAVFAPEGSFAAQRNGLFYTADDGGLLEALSGATSGDIVVMLEDQTISEDVTIPKGVKLYIPYSPDFDADGNADGVTASGSFYQASTRLATSGKTYRTLTMNEGVTLTVKGTVNIGSVIGYPSQNYQGHTSGWHGKILNNGKIVVSNGGTLDCWGYIIGEGVVTAESGGTIYEPFIVYDFAGGWNTVELYFADQSPFKQYAMLNIQTPLTINYGAILYAHCNLYADSKYNKTDANFVGEGGLYQLSPGASLTRTYDGSRYVASNDDIGKTTYTFNGGMKVNYMSLTVLGTTVNTSNVDFPIPYNHDFVFKNGTYYPGRIKLMPGSSMTVENDANLVVENTLFVLDGLIQSDMSGKIYPSTGALQSAGFSASGELVVRGNMVVNEGAIFGGIIQSNPGATKPAKVLIEHGAVVNSTGVKDGAVANYDVNTSVFDLPARAYLYNTAEDEYELAELSTGMAYTFYSDENWVIDSYEMTYAANCTEEERSPDIPVRNGKYHKWVHAVVPLNEYRNGSWTAEPYRYALELTVGTVYDPQDETKVIIAGENIDGEIPDDEDITLTVTSTEAGKGYVHLVTYARGFEEPSVLSPDGEGVYTISDVHGDISIEVISCKMGDLNQDGKIDSLDLVILRKILAGIEHPSDINALAADMYTDKRIDSLDLVILRKYFAGLHEF